MAAVLASVRAVLLAYASSLRLAFWTDVGDRTVEVPLLDGEQIVIEGFGAVGRKTGGKLIVTNLRLLFQPWDLGLPNELIKWGCKVLRIPHASAVIYIVGKAKNLVDATAQGVGNIVAVEAIGNASLFSP